MAKTKYLAIAAVVVAALGVTPLIVSHTVDSTIEANKVILEKNGFKEEFLTKSGYLMGKRTFSLEVVDAKKARDFLLTQLVAKNAQYKLFAESLQAETDEGINDALNGLKFKGEMYHSNFLPSDAKVSLSLAELPTTLQEEVRNNKAASDAILPLLTRGVLAMEMTFSPDRKLKNVKIKDIKEEIKTEEATLSIDTEKQELSLNERAGIVQGVLGVAKQNIGVSGAMFMLKSELKDFLYTFTYKDDLNTKGDMSIGSYALEMNDEYTNVKFDLGSLKLISSVDEIQKDLQIKTDFTMDAVALLDSTDDVKFDTFFAKLFMRGMNADTMKKVQADYNALVIGTTPLDDKVLIEDFVALINQGVKIDLGVVLKGLATEGLVLKDVSVDTTLVVPQNSYSDKESPLAILGLLDITAKVKVHKDDRAALEAMGLTSAEDFALGRAEGDFLVYDLALKKGAVSVNGQALQ